MKICVKHNHAIHNRTNKGTDLVLLQYKVTNLNTATCNIQHSQCEIIRLILQQVEANKQNYRRGIEAPRQCWIIEFLYQLPFRKSS